MNVRDLVEQYLDFAAAETDSKGNVRAKTTMNNYRRALEGFATAVEHAGGKLEQLPESFLENEWMATQATVAQQPIQLRVRASAVKQFSQWCFKNNVPMAPLRHPSVTIPRNPKPAPVPQERVMTPELSLADAVDSVPATNTFTPPPPAPIERTPPPPRQAVQPKAPVGSGRPANPLAAMLPTGQYKLRVRREREMDEPVWVGDFAAERVATYGAVEPFLGREVGPRLAATGVTGDITFMVSAVSPDGREGERARLTVAVAPPQPVVSAPQNYGGLPVQSIPAPVAGGDLVDLLAHHRKAQEEIEERIAQRIDRQQAAQQQRDARSIEPVRPMSRRDDDDDEISELKSMVRSLAGSVNSLAARIESRESDRFDGFAAAQQAAPAAPQLDLLSVIKEVAALSRPTTPAAPVQPPMGMGEMFTLFGQMKSVFQPQQVNIDVSPLEERMEDLTKLVSQQVKGKSRTMEMVEEFKAMKELFSMVGGGTDAPKPTGLSSALGSLVDKLVNDPEPLAAAVERVLTATAGLKAAQNGRPVPSPTNQQSPSASVPESVRNAMKSMVAADGPESLVVAAHEWLTAMAETPALRKVAERMTTLIREEKKTELAIYIKQVFGKLGGNIEVNVAQRMADDIIAQVAAANETDEDGEEVLEQEVVSAPADYTVRVGGSSASQDDGEEVVEDEQADDGEDDGEEADDEDGDDEEEGDDEEVDAADFSAEDIAKAIGG